MAKTIKELAEEYVLNSRDDEIVSYESFIEGANAVRMEFQEIIKEANFATMGGEKILYANIVKAFIQKIKELKGE